MSVRDRYRKRDPILGFLERRTRIDDSITVPFTVSPAVRGIRFHNPDALSAWGYTFFHKMTPGGVLRDGLPWSEAMKGLMRALMRIEPGSVADLEIHAAEGGLLGTD